MVHSFQRALYNRGGLISATHCWSVSPFLPTILLPSRDEAFKTLMLFLHKLFRPQMFLGKRGENWCISTWHKFNIFWLDSFHNPTIRIFSLRYAIKIIGLCGWLKCFIYNMVQAHKGFARGSRSLHGSLSCYRIHWRWYLVQDCSFVRGHCVTAWTCR
jgi:hypothetical protein